MQTIKLETLQALLGRAEIEWGELFTVDDKDWVVMDIDGDTVEVILATDADESEVDDD